MNNTKNKTRLFLGDNIELLRKLPDNSVDSIVTDAPYGLGQEPNPTEVMQSWITYGYHEIKGKGFMGKEWDAFVPQPLFWKEAYRVLKHGGYVLCFFGTRTYDWGVMAMRFAGFEVRDCIQWLYGSGFPKALDVSKAIDKIGGESLDWFIDYVLEVAEEKGITKKELTMLFPSKNGKPTGWLWNKQNNQSITLEQYNTIKDYLELPFDNIEEAKREIIGTGKAGLTKGSIANFSGETEFDLTAPAIDAAKQWQGWKSALKPANEPIVLARKPLEKGLSIAENVLKHSTGALNIDGCRVGLNGSENLAATQKNFDSMGYHGAENTEGVQTYNSQGRFPANLILTHHPDCECIGTKKVKGQIDKPTNRTQKGNVWNDDNSGLRNNLPQNSGGFADENGEETVENWICVDDCPVKILDEQSGILKSGKMTPEHNRTTNESPNGIYGKFDVNHPLAETYGDTGGASRFFYTAKASKDDRNEGLKGFDVKQTTGGGGMYNEEAGSKYGSIKAPNKNFHPTVKPTELMRYLCRLITPPNGIVLDPFMGSGSTGKAAILEGFQFVGMEMEEEYFKIAEARIAKAERDYLDSISQLKLL